MTEGHKRFQQFLVLLAVGFIIFLTIYFGRLMILLRDTPGGFKVWAADKGVLGMLVFVLLVIVQVILALVPGGPFQVAGGMAYGSLLGTVLCLVGCTLGSMIVFFLVRKFGKKIVLLFFSEEQIQGIEKRIESNRSKRVMTIIFCIPGSPKDLISYYAGLTDIAPLNWLLICVFGRLPAIILSALGGSAIQDSRYGTAIIVFIILAVITAIGTAIYHKKHKDEG